MKKLYILGAIALVGVVLFFYFNASSEDRSPLGNEASILRYQIGESFTDYGFFSFTFTQSAEGYFAQGFIDLNGDGAYADDEWVVKNAPATVIKGFANRQTFTLPEALKATDLTDIPVQFALTSSPVESSGEIADGDAKTGIAPVETEVLDTEFGFDVPGSSPELKRGAGIVYAQGESTSELPDLSGGPMDCFAVATANNLMKLAADHGRSGDMPDNPHDLIEAIKSAMQWDDGITNANFLIGKAQIMTDLDWPVTTREIKQPTIEQLQQAFASGEAFEISTTMLRSASKADTGHVFTGVSSQTTGDKSTLSVHDPSTPEGTDTLEISMTGGDDPFILIKYPLWDGIVIVDAIFIQTWNETDGGSDKSTGIAPEEEKEDSRTGVGDPKIEEPIINKKPGIEATFAHVKPGEYSEIYAVATGLTPGDTIEAKLFREDSLNGAPQVVDVDENGVAHFTFRITRYGHYNVNVTGENYGYIGGTSIDVQ